MIKVILTDIEGTTSSISFVKEVLFPYAAANLERFLTDHRNQPAVAAILDEVAREASLARDDEPALTAQLQTWMAEDQKVTALKSLQGLIWRAGYQGGDYRAHIYPDAVAALHRWHDQGLTLYVYSSGSIEAQKLFFKHSEAGDMTPLFSGYFDTTIGAKRDDHSYRKIAAAIGVAPTAILFLSDVPAELDAAATAGLRTCWLQRPDDCALTKWATPHPTARDFQEITLNRPAQH